MLTPRENLLRALRREPADYVPFHLTLCSSQIETLFEKTGTRDYEAYFDLSSRTVALPETQCPNDYSKYHPSLPEGAYIDEWGVGQIPGCVAHFTQMVHPMEGFTTKEEILNYPYPDMLAEYRWQAVNQQVREVHAADKAAVYYAIQVFEPAWYLRSMEALLMDMLDNEEMAHACLDRMTEFQLQHSILAAKSGADVIVFGDDVGTQKSLMMSAEMWRKWLKPGLKRIICAAKQVNPRVIAYYHSDGVIDEIVEDLIEIGVDVLNPVQPECMDPAKCKAEFGDRLSFWGTVGVQTVMPFGTAEEVRQTVRERIETVGKGGGLCIAPSHLIEPEVPYENIIAFVQAVKEFGKYHP